MKSIKIILIAFSIEMFIGVFMYHEEIEHSLAVTANQLTSTVQIPQYDFLVFNYHNTTVLFTTILEPDEIIKAVERTKDMSAIPPMSIALYNKGKIVDVVFCGVFIPKDMQHKVTLYSEKCIDQQHYDHKKNSMLKSRKRVYILNNDTNSKEYELKWFEY